MTSFAPSQPSSAASPKSLPRSPPTSSPKMTRPIGNVRVTAPPPTSPSQTFHTVPLPSPSTKTRDLPQGKNLRWTAVALVHKLSQERERPSAAVADEIALAACDDLRSAHPNRDTAAVERNTRRRVYDALKVMVAAGCIQREGKALRWIGIDDLRQRSRNHSRSKRTDLRVAICEARRRIARKRTSTSEIRARISAFERAFTQRHDEHTAGLAPPRESLQFPFVLVKGKGLKLAFSADRKRLRVSTTAKFKLYSETDIVCLMAERRKPRPHTKKPRVSKKNRHQHPHKASPEIPPPPPPSPADSTQQIVQAITAKRMRRMEPHKIVNLALNTISKPAEDMCTSTEAGEDHRDETCDLDILDSANAESCLDSHIPVQFVKHEDEEDFFEDLRQRDQLPSQIFIHGLHPSADVSKTSSVSSDEVSPEFEHLVRNEPPREEFDQDVSMLCEEELSDSPLESDQCEPEDEKVDEHVQDSDITTSPRSATVVKQEKVLQPPTG